MVKNVCLHNPDLFVCLFSVLFELHQPITEHNNLIYYFFNIMDTGKVLHQFEIKVPKIEFNIYHTLRPGQSFTWKELTPNTFRGVLGGSLVTLEYAGGVLGCTVLARAEGAKALEPDDLRHYLRLEVSLEQLDKTWRQGGTPLGSQYLAAVSKLAVAPGVRLLRQDPVEALFSFICSQNNNVKRIFGIVQRLRAVYGAPIATVDGEAWHDFPTLEALATASVAELKEKMGLGYRAPYIVKTAQTCLSKGGRVWLERLASKEVSRAEARKELLTLSGVGPKVADCVCLYGLEKLDVAPVDVHVYSIAHRAGLGGKKCAPLTTAVIEEIGEAFREAFGEYAGWAQAVMFTADTIEPAQKRKNESEVKEKSDSGKDEDVKQPPSKKKKKTKEKKG